MIATVIHLADRSRAIRERQAAARQADALLMPYRGFVMTAAAAASWALVLWPFWLWSAR